MQGIAKHRKATRQASGDGCLSSLFWLSAMNLNPRQCNVLEGKASHGNASKSKAVSHWRRWFIEVFSLHCAVVQRMAQNNRAQQRKATRPALHGGLSESFSAQRMDKKCNAAQGQSSQAKATRQGHSMSGFVEGLSSQSMASQGIESKCTAGQSTARQRT